MPEFDRLPSWKWATDGDTLTGTVLDVRKVESQFNPGRLVTVIDVNTGNPDVGAKTLWCDSFGLRRFAEVEDPQQGDTVVVQRVGRKEFTTKDGEQRFMWEYHTECHKSPVSDLPVSEPEPVAAGADDDIPF